VIFADWKDVIWRRHCKETRAKMELSISRVTTDFGSRFDIHLPNAINVSIVGMLNVNVNAN
jgi:hypothetical protein